jgi:hypothetical protein
MFLWPQGGLLITTPEERIARWMKEGYQNVTDIPARYVGLIPSLTREVLVASGDSETGEDYYQRLSKNLENLFGRMQFDRIYDDKMYPLYNQIIWDDRYSPDAKRAALFGIKALARKHNLYELLVPYLHHSDADIRIETERIFENR